jgi:hypothetical protein
MSTRRHGLAVLSRFLRRSFALACATALLLASSANAGTVLQFGEANPADSVTATNTAGITTLSANLAVLVTNFNGVPFPFGIAMFETLSAVSTGAATSTGSTITQDFSGIVTFSSLPEGAGTLFLTATFANAVFSGSGNSGSLNATAPNVVFTSSQATFGPDAGMSLGFSNIDALSVSNGSIASFAAQDSGTFSAAVPEPSALCLASFAAVIGTLAAYGKKRMKNEPAN